MTDLFDKNTKNLIEYFQEKRDFYDNYLKILNEIDLKKFLTVYVKHMGKNSLIEFIESIEWEE